MQEIIVNLHNHSNISSGTANYYEMAQAGLNAGIDVLIVTEHNILIHEKDQYYHRDGKNVLLLAGEEIKDPARPYENHILVLDTDLELASFASDPQAVIDAVRRSGGISILAHPFAKDNRWLKKKGAPWITWPATNFTGIEIYNLLDEFYSQSRGIFSLLGNASQPELFPMGANEESILKWDELLLSGKMVNAYAGSDGRQAPEEIGFRTFPILPYEFGFRCLNNHVFVPQQLSGDVDTDKRMIYQALKAGRFFIGLDLIHPSAGFSFKADGENQTVWPGGRMRFENSVTLKIRNPKEAICRLIHNGKVVRHWEKLRSLPVVVTEPGYYRVETYLPYRNKLRCWIYSNPIYLDKA